METLATIDAPHQKNGTTGKTAEYRRARDRCQDRHATCSLRDLDTSRVRNRTEETDRNPDSELATALTLAARAPAVRTTYQRFMAHIKNGSCSKHPTSTHASFTEHENMLRNKTHNCRGSRCEIDGCQQWHHKLLHFTKKQETERNDIVASTWTSERNRCFLKIIPVRVAGPKKEIDTYALLDDGSTVTLIDSDLAQQLGARGNQQIYARTIENLQLSPQAVTKQDIDGCKHLDDIRHKLMYNQAKPKILIGQDNWHLLVATETRKGHRNQPAASLTPLGWVLHGIRTRTIGQHVHYVHNLTATTEDNMDEQLRRYFAIESLAITPKRPSNDPEQRAVNILKESTTQLEDGHYQTGCCGKNSKQKCRTITKTP
ncbi:hypothetical protein EVAR_90644_1 [Eumeta japonica]|uniref:Peptidase aspartic putative domain-containing protein n=1 Tax=Eumeta variegata TaxID=151549 RepID=A0A4C1T0T6_EUMVA|nr:hypothetical protein EVAR_90644_1 [Eumeta japonica]